MNAAAVEYKALGVFSEGLAPALTTDDEWVVIDKKGTILFSISKLGLESSGWFQDGLLAVTQKSNTMGELMGFINREGEIVIPPAYSVHSFPFFSEGLCTIQLPTPFPAPSLKINGKWGCIRKDGSFAISPVYDRLTGFGKGRAFGYKEGTGWLLLDQTGSIKGDKTFERVHFFSEGLAAVRFNGLWGFIDREGEWKIPPQFTLASPFREGYAGVLLDGYGGFIDKEGDMVFERVCRSFRPGYALYFKEGMAVIPEVLEEPVSGKRARYGYLINDGSKIPAVYDDAGDFYEGFAHVVIDGQRRIIDKSGSLMAWTKGIDMVLGFQGGLSIAIKDGKYGYINRDGVWVIQPEYDRLKPFSEGYAVAEKDGRLGYIDIHGEWLF
jgi:hypothetical protein